MSNKYKEWGSSLDASWPDPGSGRACLWQRSRVRKQKNAKLQGPEPDRLCIDDERTSKVYYLNRSGRYYYTPVSQLSSHMVKLPKYLTEPYNFI